MMADNAQSIYQQQILHMITKAEPFVRDKRTSKFMQKDNLYNKKTPLKL